MPNNTIHVTILFTYTWTDWHIIKAEKLYQYQYVESNRVTSKKSSSRKLCPLSATLVIKHSRKVTYNNYSCIGLRSKPEVHETKASWKAAFIKLKQAATCWLTTNRIIGITTIADMTMPQDVVNVNQLHHGWAELDGPWTQLSWQKWLWVWPET